LPIIPNGISGYAFVFDRYFLFMETWKDIKGFENVYQASNLGRIKSLSRKVKCRGGFRQTKDKILKLNCGRKTGYMYFDLGYRNAKLVHRIIADVFIENIFKKPCVNHINGIKSDNRVENLEWVTYSENEKHSYDVLNKKPNHGERHGSSILTNKDVVEIKQRIKNGERNIDISKDYKVVDRTNSDIRTNKRWTHITIE